MRIMSVDDSRATRLFIKDAVDVLGFEFLEAADGKQGLAVLQEEGGNVDLILLDWHMPEMDGIEMLNILKSNDLFKDIPVTMVTTETERDSVFEALNRGANNYIMKPFSQEDLIGKIMESLDMEEQV
ncbi:MAG: response regulator [Thermodesulfobacteriota bacterium]|nr:response regulator [Thermodesulfobacteriota bacterium]